LDWYGDVFTPLYIASCDITIDEEYAAHLAEPANSDFFLNVILLLIVVDVVLRFWAKI